MAVSHSSSVSTPALTWLTSSRWNDTSPPAPTSAVYRTLFWPSPFASASVPELDYFPGSNDSLLMLSSSNSSAFAAATMHCLQDDMSSSFHNETAFNSSSWDPCADGSSTLSYSGPVVQEYTPSNGSDCLSYVPGRNATVCAPRLLFDITQTGSLPCATSSGFISSWYLNVTKPPRYPTNSSTVHPLDTWTTTPMVSSSSDVFDSNVTVGNTTSTSAPLLTAAPYSLNPSIATLYPTASRFNGTFSVTPLLATQNKAVVKTVGWHWLLLALILNV